MAAVYESWAPARPEMDADDAVWNSIARGYKAFASPFVPCGEDVALLEMAVARQAERIGARSLRAVMLGVTPGIAMMRWPPQSQLVAVEISPAVIQALWPGNIVGVREAVCASWFGIPMRSGSCDVIVGDGALATCRFPGEVRKLVQSARNLLKDDGAFAFRSYVRPHLTESIESVFKALFSGDGLSVDRFKMRLYLAMQRTAQEGVAVKDAARILDRYGLNPRTMQERFGWSSAATEPFAAWPTSDAVYSFPTLDELRDLLGECFHEVSVSYPGYELGNCCPTLTCTLRQR
jgi:hypothetical protein